MRIPQDQIIRQTRDDDGHTVFIVKVVGTVPSDPKTPEEAAVERLKAWLGAPVTVSHAEPVYDTTGVLAAYSIWVER